MEAGAVLAGRLALVLVVDVVRLEDPLDLVVGFRGASGSLPPTGWADALRHRPVRVSALRKINRGINDNGDCLVIASFIAKI
jgi:hypothetical protein